MFQPHFIAARRLPLEAAGPEAERRVHSPAHVAQLAWSNLGESRHFTQSREALFQPFQGGRRQHNTQLALRGARPHVLIFDGPGLLRGRLLLHPRLVPRGIVLQNRGIRPHLLELDSLGRVSRRAHVIGTETENVFFFDLQLGPAARLMHIVRPLTDLKLFELVFWR